MNDNDLENYKFSKNLVKKRGSFENIVTFIMSCMPNISLEKLVVSGLDDINVKTYWKNYLVRRMEIYLG